MIPETTKIVIREALDTCLVECMVSEEQAAVDRDADAVDHWQFQAQRYRSTLDWLDGQ